MSKHHQSFALLAGLSLLSFACSEESSSDGGDVASELDTFEADANADAREVCRAPENVAELESGDSDEAACYFELAVELEPCEREALEANPELARALIACSRDDREALITCCEAEGPCTYSSIEMCVTDREESGEPSACAELDTQGIQDACEAASD